MSTRTKKNFYGIACGRETGIFESWAHVKDSVNGFSNNLQQGFETIQEAVTFLQQHSSFTLTDDISVTDKNGNKYKLCEYIEKPDTSISLNSSIDNLPDSGITEITEITDDIDHVDRESNQNTESNTSYTNDEPNDEPNEKPKKLETSIKLDDEHSNTQKHPGENNNIKIVNKQNESILELNQVNHLDIISSIKRLEDTLSARITALHADNIQQQIRHLKVQLQEKELDQSKTLSLLERECSETKYFRSKFEEQLQKTKQLENRIADLEQA